MEMEKVIEITELVPVDGRKSFYGKANVLWYNTGKKVLLSYGTPVLERNPNGHYVRLWGGWSATTGRHIKAFCGMSKKEFDEVEFDELDYR